jgi:23S rRNA pseudouridine2605 synthase
MEFSEDQRQPMDDNQGNDASRDGNKKEGHFRPRISKNPVNGPVSSSNYDRPRFNRPRDNNDNQQRPYRNNYNNQEGNDYHRNDGNGYARNDGNGGGYNRNDGNGYNRNYNRPSYDRPYNRDNNNRDYNSRGGGEPYNQGNGNSYNRNYNQGDNGYQPRPQYRDNREGNYEQRRPSDFQRNNNYNRDGGGQRPYNNNRPYNNYGGNGQQRGRFGNNRQGNNYVPFEKMYEQPAIDPNAPIRLNKFLANAGICSRREADEYIKAGVISVNGQISNELGVKVLPTDKVMFHEQPVQTERKIYILLNKQRDYVTTVDDPKERNTVLDLVKGACRERIYPVGRLDRSTTGVLLLTNDGDLSSKLTHPKYNKKKIYHVHLDKPLTKADMETILKGFELEDGEIHADDIQYVREDDRKEVGIEIHSGRNRIVRRIFDHLGYRVKRLDRVFFAGLTKKNLPRGKWRFLTQNEVNMLRMGAFE